MTAKDLIEKLSEVAPETEIVGGMWNGKVKTYTLIDELYVIPYDEMYADFYGTPGAFDDKLLMIRSKEVVYLGSMFDTLDKQVQDDRRVMCRMLQILQMHRSQKWKKEQLFMILTEFEGDN